MNSEEPKSKSRKPRNTNPIPFRTMNRIRSLRMARGWTQAELAAHLECSPSKVNMIEIGARGLNEEFTIKTAHLFKVSVDYILCQTDEPALSNPSPSETNDVDSAAIENHWKRVGLPGD